MARTTYSHVQGVEREGDGETYGQCGHTDEQTGQGTRRHETRGSRRKKDTEGGEHRRECEREPTATTEDIEQFDGP
jgi:hypothetical protein